MTFVPRTALLIVIGLFSGCITAPRPATGSASTLAVGVPERYAAVPRVEAGSGIEAPVVKRRVDPVLSAELRRRPRPISASVEAVINESGAVEAVWYSSGDREWAQELSRALYGWQFEPAKRNGVPVAVRYTLTSTMR